MRRPVKDPGPSPTANPSRSGTFRPSTASRSASAPGSRPPWPTPGPTGGSVRVASTSTDAPRSSRSAQDRVGVAVSMAATSMAGGPSPLSHQADDVVLEDEDHQEDEEQDAHQVRHLARAEREGPARGRLDQRGHDVAPVEHGDGQEVHEPE